MSTPFMEEQSFSALIYLVNRELTMHNLLLRFDKYLFNSYVAEQGNLEKEQDNVDWKFEVSSHENDIGQYNLSNDISRARTWTFVTRYPNYLVNFC